MILPILGAVTFSIFALAMMAGAFSQNPFDHKGGKHHG